MKRKDRRRDASGWRPTLTIEVEQTLDGAVFHRTPSGVHLTDAGQGLVEHAARLLDDLDRMIRRFELVHAGRAIPLRVAFNGPAMMHAAQQLTVTTLAGAEVIDAGYDGQGLRFQVHEVHRCVRAGLGESPVVPLDESLQLARTMDEIRAQIGLRYPSEG